MINKDYKSILDIVKDFPNEQSCIDHLEILRWNGNVISPFDSSSKIYKCKNNKYRCKNTGKYFNVKTNTIFDNTKLELQKWFLAIWIVTSHKKGISSLQLSRDLNITQKSAWFMLQRIRNCFGVDDNDNYPLDGIIEADETFVGGKNKNRHHDKKVEQCQGRSYKDKTPVLGLLQRNGIVKAFVIDNTQSKTIQPIIKKNVIYHSVLISDEWHGYRGLEKIYDHHFVDHGKRQYVNFENNEIHSNSIEGFWGILKRGYNGIYNWWSRKHMQKYVDEFVFRFNSRKMPEYDRFNMFLGRIENRITYKELIQ
ncbi:IS1595 family transposase [Flavobacterium amniphilum]|uniref:IS1595 family transposase n=1 Tax=Flavobacterium amniphilum TaxID=1834035 RepID=UPI00202A1A79|nr:IS1595 family transposase [Flavobacterium amniphilum]MCL9807244.1 IS1595 family transposase [Flavobacterium amniphilum]